MGGGLFLGGVLPGEGRGDKECPIGGILFWGGEAPIGDAVWLSGAD